MNLNQLAGLAMRFVKANSTEIASALAGVGVVSTAILTAKATFRAAEVIRANEEGNVPFESERERVWTRTKLVWKLYVPPVFSASVAIGCVFLSNRFAAQKILAATTTLAVSERAYSAYRDKVVEEFSKRKDQSIRDKVVAKQIEKTPPPPNNVLVTGPGNVLCCELYTMRYFVSDMESLRKAENRVNSHSLKHDYTTLDEFYYYVGLRNTTVSGNLGWSGDKLMELEFSTNMTEDGRPCIAFDYNYVQPL